MVKSRKSTLKGAPSTSVYGLSFSVVAHSSQQDIRSPTKVCRACYIVRIDNVTISFILDIDNAIVLSVREIYNCTTLSILETESDAAI